MLYRPIEITPQLVMHPHSSFAGEIARLDVELGEEPSAPLSRNDLERLRDACNEALGEQ